MNYKESEDILNKIKAANKVLINCHHLPDADSVGSAAAMKRVLEYFYKKEAKIICPSPIPTNLNFLKEKVETVDFSKFDYKDYDLFILLDTSSWNRASGSHDIAKPNIPMIVLDHHHTNQEFGDINLIVTGAAANSEIVYDIFKDWGLDVVDKKDKMPDIATPLLTGIIGDTGSFRFPEANEKTFSVASDLMRVADKNEIVFNLYQSYQQNHIKVWRSILDNLEVDTEHKFVYSFIEKNIFIDSGRPFNAKSEMADMIFQSIEDTDFGIVGVEDEDYVSVSFRSRTGFNVAKLAAKLGGGGHVWASACRIKGLSLAEAKEKVLTTAIELIDEEK